MDDEKLILIVQDYRELYDTSDSNYLNHLRRENIWEEIEQKMGYTRDECRKRWATIRECYRKSLRKRKTKSGQGASTPKPWRLEQQMEFMIPFLADRQQHPNISQEEGETAGNVIDADQTDTQSTSSTSNIGLPRKRSRTPGNSSAEILHDYIAYKRNKPRETTDHLTRYFQAIEETVRTFPPILQIETKKKISDIMFELELRAVQLAHCAEERSSNYQHYSSPSNILHYTSSPTKIPSSYCSSSRLDPQQQGYSRKSAQAGSPALREPKHDDDNFF